VSVLVGVTFDTMRSSSRLSLSWVRLLKSKISGGE
jgi:ribose transport system permease protein